MISADIFPENVTVAVVLENVDTPLEGAVVLSTNGPADTFEEPYTWFPNALIENVYELPLVRFSMTIFDDREEPTMFFPVISR